MSIYAIAAIWVGLAIVACLVSEKTGMTLALVEILIGVVAGNIIDLQIGEWVDYLAAVGPLLLTFLAGADINPAHIRQNLKPTLAIGLISFLLPFAVGFCAALFVLQWSPEAARIAGIALSTTSVAVVYTILWETGLNETHLGQSILAACFVTDFGTVLLLGLMFTGFTWKTVALVVVTVLVCFLARPIAERASRLFGGGTTEGEIKLVLLMLLGLGALAIFAGSEAVLPSYILGFVLASFFMERKDVIEKIRIVGYVAFLPFYFIKAGSLVSLAAVATPIALASIVLFFLVKVASKTVGILSVMKVFSFSTRDGAFASMLMSTGLTFGTISALYGLTHGFVTPSQYAMLVTAIIATAVIPTIAAQQFFMPERTESGEER